MNQKQQQVANYISDREQNILHWKIKNEVNEKLSKLNLDDLIIQTVGLTSIYNSYNEKNMRTCYDDRWRSSLDIWRHVKFYKPDVTIFQVMNSLFSLQDKLIGHYCEQIWRRVFRKKIGNSTSILRGLRERDEYNLTFYEWENIDKE